MAKLDKTQQKYALERIGNMANAAANKAKYVPDKYDNEAVVAQLLKKGFTVNTSYSLRGYVSIAKTASQQAAIDKAMATADKKVKEIYDAAQEAKDQVMLGDSTEVTTILASLAKKLGV